MRAVVHAAQAAAVDVAVQLRRGQGAVAQQLLDSAQVGAALQQVRGEGVPQAMRMREHAANRGGVEPPPARGQEQRILRPAHELGPCLVEVAGQRVRGLFSERNDPLLAALPPNMKLFAVEVDVADVESNRLGAAQPSRVDQLDERMVSNRERLVAVQRNQRRLHFRRFRRVRQAPRAPRCERRIRDLRRPQGEPQKAPDRSELAGDRRRRKLPRPRSSQLGRVLRERPDVYLREREAMLFQPAAELFDVPPIGASRALAESR